jgi:alpha-galactosidase
MLDPDAHYRVTELRPESVRPGAIASHQAFLLDAIGSADGAQFSGAWLVHAGLPIPRGKAETAYIVRIQRQKAVQLSSISKKQDVRFGS